VHISAANSFENAQVTAGGIDMAEVTKNLESIKMPGIYFAGEMLDVDGRCGGYNLQWAWTSGYIAGRGAAN
ncbi:MAG: NAD(P)/FAD-dependent oxidoreductase, partial [Kineothrix sp.]|nr:NAD(P)/FAD-dependent oxidoreductase [Kineothrix sp.]